jgi:hypothetical protein
MAWVKMATTTGALKGRHIDRSGEYAVFGTGKTAIELESVIE